MGLGEADTRAKLIDPKLHQRGWTEDTITREENAGENYIDHRGKPRKGRKRIDYVLRLRIAAEAQPVAVAMVEAKAEEFLPERGLEQVKRYQATSRRLNVPFVFSSNGHLFVEYDHFTGDTSRPRPLEEFPTADELRERYERQKGFSLEDDAARPLLMPYRGGEGTRRYYQDAAIRATLEKLAKVEAQIARGEADPTDRRALLSLATGAGKTFIAVNLLERIAAAGQMGRALFICDRDELRIQASTAFQGAFGADAAIVTGRKPQKNARVLIATYQTFDANHTDDPDASFLIDNYPPGFFSHIIIDECHRSGWGKWSTVFKMNEEAVQIGLTATPRTLEISEENAEFQADLKITGDNVQYFGEPVYEYDLSQGIQDGYLAVPEIILSTVNVDPTGLTRDELIALRVTDAMTGEKITSQEQLDEIYQKTSYEDRLMLPDRVQAMAADFFNHLLETGEPEQKTIIFCVRHSHAEAVAEALNNIYARWCKANKRKRLDPFAFVATQQGTGGSLLAELKESGRSHFVATTVNLLEAGVDVPWLRNVGFFRYLNSPISFYQMLGRGTRVVPFPDYTKQAKLSFHVYDYTDATRLLGQDFQTKHKKDKIESPPDDFDDDDLKPDRQIFRVEGLEAHVTMAGRFIVTSVNGKEARLTEEEYRAAVAARLREQVATLDEFRARWIDRRTRQALLDGLPNGSSSALAVQQLADMSAYDLYDVLAELAFGLKPLTRPERADAFQYKHDAWLAELPQATAATLLALTAQFSREGTDGLESRFVWETPEVRSAGGFDALKQFGKPAEILHGTKERIFAA